MKIQLPALTFAVSSVFLSFGQPVFAVEPIAAQWQQFSSLDGSQLTERHEAAAVVIDQAIYLIGGRGADRPVERYSTITGQWENLGFAPLELHHVQPVTIDKRIYLLGAFTCCYPREQAVAEIHIFDTETEAWSVDDVGIPQDRVRGSAAAFVRNEKIYLLGGNTQGHSGGAVPWFDEYDPVERQWRQLPDAPHARDHFSAVLINDQVIASAGRQTNMPNPAANPVPATDVYDFISGEWHTAASIPTVRAGAVAIGYGGEVIVAGGEINTTADALNTVEAYDAETDSWQIMPSMTLGRHGSGGGVIGSRFYMLSGAFTAGGRDETSTSEYLDLPEIPEMPETPETPETPGIVDPADPGTSGGSISRFLLLAFLLILALRKPFVWVHRE